MSNLHDHEHSALQDIRHSRYLADLNRIAARIKKTAPFLLLYDELFTQIHTSRSSERIQQKIPLNAIVGAVQRDTDFTDKFLRSHAPGQKHWATVEILMTGMKDDLPPIDVYQIGEIYIISDGHRRASIAQQLGATVIEAMVTSLTSPAPSDKEISPDELILLSERADFLARTKLDNAAGFQDYHITVPGKYPLLADQIAVYQKVAQIEDALSLSYQEAAAAWHKNVYLPLVAMIEPLETLRDFPQRTASDLYLWITEHRTFIRRLSTRYCEASTSEMWDMLAASLKALPEKAEHHAETEYVDFLEQTGLRQLCPEADVQLTVPGKYQLLEEHIRVHRYFMGLEQQRKIPYDTAVKHWYDSVYLPIVKVIRQQHLPEDFPAHTLADLYLWISEFQFIARQEDVIAAELYLAEMWAHLDNFPYVDIEELMIKIESIDFLLYTHLTELRPQAELEVSTPEKYRVLEKHIEVHRYFMGIDQQREISFPEAAAHWYDQIYVPVVNIIEGQRMLYEFPDLTATDLYLWIAEHQSLLKEQFGSLPDTESVVEDLVSRFGSHKSSPMLRKRETKMESARSAIPRTERVADDRTQHAIAVRRQEHLFVDILVPLNGRKDGWANLDLALAIAQREEASVSGLHIVSSKHQLDSPAVFKLQQQFEQRCHGAGIHGNLTLEVGHLAEKIVQYARQADLLLLQLLHAPHIQRVPRFQATFRALYRHCNSLLLAVPEDVPSSLHSVLCVYDGSPKANQALFVCTYLAGCWDVSLTIMTTANIDANHCSFIKNYVHRREVEADFLQQRSRMSDYLPKVVQECHSDVLVLGGSGYHPLLEDIFHKAFEQWSTTIQIPLLIC